MKNEYDECISEIKKSILLRELKCLFINYRMDNYDETDDEPYYHGDVNDNNVVYYYFCDYINTFKTYSDIKYQVGTIFGVGGTEQSDGVLLYYGLIPNVLRQKAWRWKM